MCIAFLLKQVESAIVRIITFPSERRFPRNRMHLTAGIREKIKIWKKSEVTCETTKMLPAV